MTKLPPEEGPGYNSGQEGAATVPSDLQASEEQIKMKDEALRLLTEVEPKAKNN